MWLWFQALILIENMWALHVDVIIYFIFWLECFVNNFFFMVVIFVFMVVLVVVVVVVAAILNFNMMTWMG